MKLAVVGAGPVGLAAAVGFAEVGHRVVCCENNPVRFAALADGRAPFAEPEMAEKIPVLVADGRLRFCQDIAVAAADARVVFFAVPVKDSPAAMRVFFAVALAAVQANLDCILAVKSTVPPGTCAALEKHLSSKHFPKIAVVSNPEFLRRGNALRDFLSPSRIIVAAKVMREIYAPIISKGARYFLIGRESAEVAKLSANVFLAVRVALINECADLCEGVGGDIGEVIEVVSADARIGGAYLNPGPGFGGACLPKDSRMFIRAAQKSGIKSRIIKAAMESNKCRAELIADKIMRSAPLSANDSTAAIWGVAFKPGADDACESPAVMVCRHLLMRGVRLRIYDPAAELSARPELPQAEFFCGRMQAITNADALIILTAWPEFAKASPTQIRRAMKGKVVFDAVRILSRKSAAKAGLQLHAIGESFIRR